MLAVQYYDGTIAKNACHLVILFQEIKNCRHTQDSIQAQAFECIFEQTCTISWSNHPCGWHRSTLCWVNKNCPHFRVPSATTNQSQRTDKVPNVFIIQFVRRMLIMYPWRFYETCWTMEAIFSSSVSNAANRVPTSLRISMAFSPTCYMYYRVFKIRRRTFTLFPQCAGNYWVYSKASKTHSYRVFNLHYVYSL